MRELLSNNSRFLARLHEVHRAIVVTSVVRVYDRAVVISLRPLHTFG